MEDLMNMKVSKDVNNKDCMYDRDKGWELTDPSPARD